VWDDEARGRLAHRVFGGGMHCVFVFSLAGLRLTCLAGFLVMLVWLSEKLAWHHQQDCRNHSRLAHVFTEPSQRCAR